MRARSAEDVRPEYRLPDNQPFGERDASQGTEVRIAALDELAEPGRRQSRFDATGRWHELRAVAGQRVTLALILGGHVDDERGRNGVVDEVMADPVGPPGVRLDTARVAWRKKTAQAPLKTARVRTSLAARWSGWRSSQ